MMKFSYVLKAAAALGLASTLAGCFDVDMEVNVVGADKALATITTTLPSELVSLADLEEGNAEFCGMDAVITEGEDVITCVETHEGTFEDVLPKSESDEPQPTIALISPGKVKVTFPTDTLSEDLGGDDSADAQTMQMMKQMFEGHAITMRVVGHQIIETNMNKSADGKSAEMSIKFTDLIDGTADIPAETYAIVQLP